MTPAVAVPRPPDAASRVLVFLFVLGIYLGIAARLPGGIPVPAILAGATGCFLLLAEWSRIRDRHLMAIFAVLALYGFTVLMAPEYRYLVERFKGLVQLTYSLAVAYGFFLAVTRFSRRQLARLFLGFCIAILIGCALENYTPFKQVSDAFRGLAFDAGVYTADLRDELFYGRIRPKVFTSEPSAVAFMFTLFGFAWYVLSDSRYKIVGYLAMAAAGYFLMRGPTLFIGPLLVPVYELLLASRCGPPGRTHLKLDRAAGAVLLALAVVVIAIPLLQLTYADRVQAILSGEDPSFFSRVIAPPLVAFKVLAANPLAGAGLTGWEFIEKPTMQVYATSNMFASSYRFEGASHAITNYFWLHWIFLGLLGGGVLLIAISVLLYALGVPSLLFCWLVWAAFGQAAGSYVGPQAWTVLFLAAAIAVVHERSRVQKTLSQAAPPPAQLPSRIAWTPGPKPVALPAPMGPSP